MKIVAKTIYTQFDEMVNYDNIVKIGIKTNWEDADISDDGTIAPDFEMVGRDITGLEIPIGIYKTYEEAEEAVRHSMSSLRIRHTQSTKSQSPRELIPDG